MSRKTLCGVVIITTALFAGFAFAQDAASEEAKQAQPAAAAGAPDQAPADAAAAEPADAAAQAASEPAPTAAQGDSGAAVVQLKDLEQRVNELKERIFRSKARLNLLKETVLHGVIAGSRGVLKHKNEMGGMFRLIKLVYAVDGQQVYSKSATDGSLDDRREFDIFNGSIVPGSHTISTTMVFRGNGYGLFTYLKGYKFTVRASHTFTAAEGRQNVIVVRAFEKGNATTELRDRPAIKFETSLYKFREEASK